MDFVVDRRSLLVATLAGGAAALLPGAPLAASAVLGRFSVRNPGAAAAPVTLGVAAPQGAVPVGSQVGVKGAPSQLDWLNAWPDGSLRFGIVSALLPPVGREGLIVVEPGKPDNRPFADAAAVAKWLTGHGGTPRIAWTDRDGGTFFADAADALAGATRWSAERAHLAGRWLSGPVCTEWVASTPLVTKQGIRHRSLRAWFHLRAWSDGRGGIAAVRADAILDNAVGPRDPNVIDAIGDMSVRRGDVVVWARTGGTPNTSLRPDEPLGRRERARNIVMLGTDGGLKADDLFKLVETEGTLLHLVGLDGPRIVAQILHKPDLLVAQKGASVAGTLEARGGWLNTSRRVAVWARDGQDLSGRRFTVEGTAPDGSGISEVIVGPAPGPVPAQGKKLFARVTRVLVDGPTNGKVDVGSAPMSGAAAPAAWRMWGMALAPWTRWPVRLWYGAQDPEAIPDPEMYRRARLLPNIDPALKPKRLPEFIDNLDRAVRAQSDPEGRPLPNTRDLKAPDFSVLNVVIAGAQGGGRPDLGCISGHGVAWVLQPDSREAWRAMMAAAVALNQWPWHWKDKETGVGVDPGRHPTFSYHFNEPDANRPPHMPNFGASISQMGTDPAHWIEFAYVPFIATGDLVHYETLYDSAFAAWAWTPSRWPMRTASTGYERALPAATGRDIAWPWRSLGHLRAVGPDRLHDEGVTSPRAVIDRIFQTQQRWLRLWLVEGPDMYGVSPKQRGDHKFTESAMGNGEAYSPWKQGYLAIVLSHLLELDVLDANGKAFHDWYRPFLVDLYDPKKTCAAAVATAYYWRCKTADGTPLGSIAQAYAWMAEKEWAEPNLPEFEPIAPQAELRLDGATLVAAPQNDRGKAGVFDDRYLGRGLFTVPDKGRATIITLENPVDGRSNRVRVRIDKPLSQPAYASGQWRVQYPAPGPSRWAVLDHTRNVPDWFWIAMAGLAALAGTGTPGAEEAWLRMRAMAKASAGDITDAPGRDCQWAIGPRGVKLG